MDVLYRMAVLFQLGVCVVLMLLKSSTSDAACDCATEFASIQSDLVEVKADLAAIKSHLGVPGMLKQD